MATYGQGAPGVRIRLRDASAVNLVTNPKITAGIVGYASKGELNKIIDLTSTADQDTLLGSGYNNSKFNQGLYAARAIINGGGFVEYVRPYGETVITDSDDPDYARNQDLKTDTYVVGYDFNPASDDSFTIDYYAATRYETDGLTASYGAGNSRKINTVAETLTENKNVDFAIDAEGTSTQIPLFAIMNTDPTAANRGGDRIVINSISYNAGTISVITTSPHNYSDGDTVVIANTTNYNTTSAVVTVTGANKFEYTASLSTPPAETSGVSIKNSDSVDSGVDYLSVKTVANGKASKRLGYFKLTGGANVIKVANSGDTFTIADSNNVTHTFELVDAEGGDQVTGSNIEVDIVYDTFAYQAANTLAVVDITKFAVNDIVSVVITSTGGSDALPTGLAVSTDYIISSISGDYITLSTMAGVAVTISAAGVGTFRMYNQSGLLRNIMTAMKTIGYATNSNARGTFDGALVGTVEANTIQLPSGTSSNYTVNDYIMFNNLTTYSGSVSVSTLGLDATLIYQIHSINLAADTIKLKFVDTGAIVPLTTGGSYTFKILNLSEAVVSSVLNDGNRLEVDIIGVLGLTVPADDQDTYVGFVDTTDLTAEMTTDTVGATAIPLISETADRIIIDATVGRTFLSLGLATEDYVDYNFDGTDERVFMLTADGEAVARMYLFVTYYFGGVSYTFSGTIVPYVQNDTNLEIQQQADSVANGWVFVLNQNIALETAVLDPTFDLSQSKANGNISGSFSQIAFNPDDPAITYDAIWEYDPRNNSSSATLGNAWNLFLNKDESRSDMLVACGTAISNLFIKGMEQINYNVMDSMLGICEKRKDMFAIFDGVDEPKIDTALKKMVGIGSEGDIARWGSIFDGRSIFFDSVYTKLNVQAVKSIEVAAIITLNRAANVYWLPPAGYETGRIPAALSSKQKFIRTYNYADDPNSDIARLYDANINPTRVNDQGQFIYGQKTMLKRMTALNRLNVIMLIAGIHKRFGDFLDRKVFQLNTPALRASITAELQAQLELIKSANPAGLTEGVVICDETNNTADIIDTNQLIVDIFLQPTRTAEFITLRTTVQRTGDTATISGTTITGG